MKIGDRVFVHGYIDEIRKDTVIIRNNGGYFGTIPSEVITGALPSAEPEPKPISYMECANAMLKMWIDNVLTDGEYHRIMDKLNSKHMADMRGEEE